MGGSNSKIYFQRRKIFNPPSLYFDPFVPSKKLMNFLSSTFFRHAIIFPAFSFYFRPLLYPHSHFFKFQYRTCFLLLRCHILQLDWPSWTYHRSFPLSFYERGTRRAKKWCYFILYFLQIDILTLPVQRTKYVLKELWRRIFFPLSEPCVPYWWLTNGKISCLDIDASTSEMVEIFFSFFMFYFVMLMTDKITGIALGKDKHLFIREGHENFATGWMNLTKWASCIKEGDKMYAFVLLTAKTIWEVNAGIHILRTSWIL